MRKSYLFKMENTSSNVYKLNNGLSMPRIGLGTSDVKDLANIVYESIKDGVRMIDTAHIYRNEKEVGEGINKAINENLVKREDLFVITKIWYYHKSDPEKAIRESLEKLNLSYVDLYLDHWPISTFISNVNGERVNNSIHKFWPKMENLVKIGLTKSIGTSNYGVQLLMDLLTWAEIKPVVNEVEFHPYLTNQELLRFLKGNNIQLLAYNSIVRGGYVKTHHGNANLNLLEEDSIKELAKKYGKNEGQIALAWALGQGAAVIPSTSNPRRMKDNLQSLDSNLTKEEIAELNKLNQNYRFCSTLNWNMGDGYDVFA
jgi:diketogulonate reductase-like aldo/keto reductase